MIIKIKEDYDDDVFLSEMFSGFFDIPDTYFAIANVILNYSNDLNYLDTEEKFKDVLSSEVLDYLKSNSARLYSELKEEIHSLKENNIEYDFKSYQGFEEYHNARKAIKEFKKFKDWSDLWEVFIEDVVEKE